MKKFCLFALFSFFFFWDVFSLGGVEELREDADSSSVSSSSVSSLSVFEFDEEQEVSVFSEEDKKKFVKRLFSGFKYISGSHSVACVEQDFQSIHDLQEAEDISACVSEILRLFDWKDIRGKGPPQMVLPTLTGFFINRIIFKDHPERRKFVVDAIVTYLFPLKESRSIQPHFINFMSRVAQCETKEEVANDAEKFIDGLERRRQKPKCHKPHGLKKKARGQRSSLYQSPKSSPQQKRRGGGHRR